MKTGPRANIPIYYGREEKRGFEPGADWYQFRTAPSCPPDKRIHMRGGLGWNGPGYSWTDSPYYGWWVPDRIADLEDTDSVTVDITFTTAGYYLGYALALLIPEAPDSPAANDWNFTLIGTDDEQATAQEAEDDLLTWLQQSNWGVWAWRGDALGYEVGYPLCGMVLKNDGTVGAGAHILPIDSVNRGRSYIFLPDLRPRNIQFA